MRELLAVTRTLRAILLAIFFVGSGLLTYQIYYWVAKSGPDETQLVRQLVTGLPFAVACSFRFMTSRKWILPAIILDCIAWIAALRLGLALGDRISPYLAMSIAGIVGALMVTIATSLGNANLYGRHVLFGATAAGAIAGAPFGLVFTQNRHENMILAICFPLWQVAVGLWIYVSCTQPTAE